jgi:hypothetical protein
MILKVFILLLFGCNGIHSCQKDPKTIPQRFYDPILNRPYQHRLSYLEIPTYASCNDDSYTIEQFPKNRNKKRLYHEDTEQNQAEENYLKNQQNNSKKSYEIDCCVCQTICCTGILAIINCLILH